MQEQTNKQTNKKLYMDVMQLWHEILLRSNTIDDEHSEHQGSRTHRQTSAFLSFPACHKISANAKVTHFLWCAMTVAGLERRAQIAASIN